MTIDGQLYSRVGRSEATYNTAAGPVIMNRALYRKAGIRNDRVVDAISLRAGVVGDGWLPGAARAMAYLLQQGTSRDAANTARELGRLPYSRSSFERVGHAVGELYAARNVEIEEALIEATIIPDEARSVSVSLDRVSVPMEEPRPRSPGRPAKNAPKRPISRNFRMAYCGTVTLHDAMGEALHTIRYGRMPNGDAVALREGLADDVRSMLARRPDLAISLLADGASEMWNLLDVQLCPAQLGGRSVHRLIDLYHLLEKLGAAAKVIHAEGSSAAVKRWHLRLLNDSGAALKIARELERPGMREVHIGDSRPVHDAITYLENNSDRMDYATARANGLPVGSGNVEATCRAWWRFG